MNSIFFRHGVANPARCLKLGAAVGIAIFVLLPPSVSLQAQIGGDSIAAFKGLAAELSADRLGGGAEDESRQDKALAYLDSVTMAILNGSASPDLDAANQRFAELTSNTPPVGENYRLMKLGGNPATYALVVNFGLGGPAAVRIYSGVTGHYSLAGRIDRFTQKDFLDSDIELLPVSTSDLVFVTIAGRTDDLSTGMFSAWRFDGHNVVTLWSSDLLQQSNYEADADGFHLTYCGQTDDDRPSQCLKMTRDLYRFQAGEWKRAETADLPPVEPTKK